MLTIHFGTCENEIYNPPIWFDNRYEDEWITDPLTKEMILDVDKSEVIGPHLIESPVLGPISVKEISGGVKTLILMAFDQSGKIFNASSCGNNCAKWIVKIAESKDLCIVLHHVMDFSGIPGFEAIIDNTGTHVSDFSEYLKTALSIDERRM